MGVSLKREFDVGKRKKGSNIGFIGSIHRITWHYEQIVAHNSFGQFIGAAFTNGGKLAESDVTIPLAHYSDPGELLKFQEIDCLIIDIDSIDERAFWCRRAIEQNLRVLVSSPIGKNNAQIRRAGESLQAGRGELGLVVDPSLLEAEETLLDLHTDIGNVLFFNLLIQPGRSGTGGLVEGALVHYAIDWLGVMWKHWGPVDSIWAQTRNMSLKCPAEDVATAYLKFRNGKEGVMQVDAIGREKGICLNIVGRTGSWELTRPWADWQTRWGALYDNLDISPSDTGRKIQRETVYKRQEYGMKLANWIKQSARLQREISSKEVDNG